MRKFYTNYVLPAAVFAVSLLSYGCVDREYSLDNIDGGGSISVGDVITTPPVTAHLTFEGILGGMDEVERILEENGLSFEDIGFVEMYIGEELFLVNLPLDIPLIPEGMTDTFLPEGDDKVELLLDIASTLPMAMDLKIEFTDASGAVVTAFDTISIAKAGEGEEFGAQERLDIADVIGRISDIAGMNVTLLRPDLEKVKFLLDNYIEVGGRLEKTGGIKLPL